MRRLGGRERAQAQRLAYGAVQRRGTTDAAIDGSPSARRGMLDPPVLAGLRLGLYELLFADGDPRPRRRRPGGRAGQEGRAPRTPPASSTRCCAAPSASATALTATLLGDDSTPELAAVAHSAPLWLARMWWEELGAEGARSLLAACNEPAEVALRVDHAARDREAMIAVAGASRASRPRAPEAPWPLAPPESIVVEGRTGERRPGPGRGRRADPAEPRLGRGGRGARPAARRARPRPLRRARDQDRPDRRADGGSRRGDLGRARPGARGRSRRTRRGGSACAASP